MHNPSKNSALYIQVQLQDTFLDRPHHRTFPVVAVKCGNCRAIAGPLDCGAFSGSDYMGN